MNAPTQSTMLLEGPPQVPGTPPIEPPPAMEPTPPKRRGRRIAAIGVAAGLVAGVAGAGVWAWSSHQASERSERAEARAEELRTEYTESFADLFADVNALEDLTETYAGQGTAADDRFFTEWDEDASFEEFQEIGQVWYDEAFAAATDFGEEAPAMIAELDAKQVAESEFGDLDAVRDAAVSHYRLWMDESYEYPSAIYDWVFVDTSTDDFVTFSGPRLDPIYEEIDSAFATLCSGLSDAQPAGGEFTDDISRMCEF